jgi:cytochrome oxidase assembly protein ShyY1
MLSGYSFHPRGWAIAAAAAACTAFVLLGNWQARRAEEKRALAAEMQNRRTALTGTFLPQYTVLLDNKIRSHRAGYDVVTPLRVDGESVLVLRGWIEAGPSRAVLPEVKTPAGAVKVEGIALERLPRLLHLAEPPGARLRQSIELPQFAAETGLRLRPMFLEQTSAIDDGLVRDWPAPDTGVAMHESYALQWYSFAAATVVLFVVLSFRRVAAR